jgi:hypothetical protein
MHGVGIKKSSERSLDCFSLSLLVMILPEDILKEACFCQILWAILIDHNQCIKCNKSKDVGF